MLGVGVVAAVVMSMLGLWQAQRSSQVGDGAIAARASEAPVPLLEWIHPDGTVADIYGKPVTVTGTYLPAEQLLVRSEDGTVRVLTALQVSDGRVVPVVRGTLSASATPPPPPSGPRTETGLFLPGEADDARPVGAGELASVRTPLIAQHWPQQVTPGFVTLDAAGASAQGLGAAAVTLPHGDKSLQNGSYAIQWWIFAAFALLMSWRLAHGFAERDRLAEERDALEGAATVEPTPATARAAMPGAREDD